MSKVYAVTRQFVDSIHGDSAVAYVEFFARKNDAFKAMDAMVAQDMSGASCYRGVLKTRSTRSLVGKPVEETSWNEVARRNETIINKSWGKEYAVEMYVSTEGSEPTRF